MQTLFVKTLTGMKKIIVHRSWKDISGAEIFLHADGSYANKDKSPLKRREELDILPQAQRLAAQRWWDRIGAKQSADFYQAIDEQAAAIAGDFQDKAADSTELDSALYTRRSRKGGAISGAHAWLEWFDSRPDWWGQADAISFNDYVYTRADLEAAAPETEADTQKATKPAGKKAKASILAAGEKMEEAEAEKDGDEAGPE